MEAAAGFAAQPRQDRRSDTPIANSATFIVSNLDVGSAAVRAGVAVQLEQERQLLLSAAKLVLGRIRAGQIQIGEAYVTALATAIRVAEVGPTP